jgi:mRNA-degrading endonuclease HigB of HigAB toxin-antitoxin module
MKVLKKPILFEFLQENPDAEQPLIAWISAVKAGMYTADVLRLFPKAQISGQTITFEIVPQKCHVTVAVKHPVFLVKSITKTPNVCR